MKFTITTAASFLAFAATAVNGKPTPDQLSKRANSWTVRVSNSFEGDQCPGGSSYSGTTSQGCTIVPESQYVSVTVTGTCNVGVADDTACADAYHFYEGQGANCFPSPGWKAFIVTDC
jgi:hypothetical protein